MAEQSILEVISVDLSGVHDAPPAWSGSLDASERSRLTRLRRAEDRAGFAAAHALARMVVADRLGKTPRDLRFHAATGGKPCLAAEEHGGTLSFNLSHADGMVAVALSETHEVGVDVEALDRARVDDDLAAFAFAPEEAKALRTLEGAAWRAAFFDLWTAKEAVAKATGLGLSLPVAGIAVDGAAHRARLTGESLAVAGDGLPRTWALWRRTAASGHAICAAVAAEGLPPGEPWVAWRSLDAATLTRLVARSGRAGG